MPLYEYQCKECSNIQEEWHGMSESPSVNCNKCNSSSKRIVSAVRGRVKDSNAKPYWHPDMKPSEFVAGKE